MYRVTTVLRSIARGGLAGLAAGLLVGGVGGRIAMSVAAVLNPGAAGELTEAGEVVGRFTVSGTLALVAFGGLSAGAVGGVVWVVVSPWLPGRLRWRILLAMPIAVALGSFLLIESPNRDFQILGPLPLILAMLVGLIALAGAATAWFDALLERRLPAPNHRPTRALFTYGVIAILGTPLLLLTFLAYFSPAFATSARPPGVGAALVVVGLATVVTWVLRLRADAPAVPRAVAVVARVGLAAAVTLGAVHLSLELSRIAGQA